MIIAEDMILFEKLTKSYKKNAPRVVSSLNQYFLMINVQGTCLFLKLLFRKSFPSRIFKRNKTTNSGRIVEIAYIALPPM